MRRQLLFVQGGGMGTHDEWDSILVESVASELGSDYDIRYPLMPDEGNPHYASWKVAIEKELAALNDDAILIGHSIGGTILVNTLAEQQVGKTFGALILIAAPFVGDGGWSSDDLESPSDLGARLAQAVPIHVFHGLEDETAPPFHAELYARAIPQATIHRLPGRDHQINNDLKEIAAVIKLHGGEV